MVHFNALDFNVCRSEEVISFFWRSVYIINSPENTCVRETILAQNKKLFCIVMKYFVCTESDQFASQTDISKISNFEGL